MSTESNILYPLVFHPILKEKIWGGRRLSHFFDFNATNKERIGEAFSVSTLKGDCSVVKNGVLSGKKLDELIAIYKEDLVGTKQYAKFQTNLSLLVKIIDAQDDLSIQVHPDAVIAQKRYATQGKNELWYLLDSHKDSMITSGFNQSISKDSFINTVEHGGLNKLVNTFNSKPGDFIYIPSGRIHSIGKGNLIIEVQQSSDVTYRVYDFDRRDNSGKKRELHLDKAIEAINFSDTNTGLIEADKNGELFFNGPDFHCRVLKITGSRVVDYSQLDSFVILINIGEVCELVHNSTRLVLKTMESVLIPAALSCLEVCSEDNIKLLEVFTD